VKLNESECVWSWPWPSCICGAGDPEPEGNHMWYCNLAAKPRQLTNEQIREMMA
jgi:hypothetical protein